MTGEEQAERDVWVYLNELTGEALDRAGAKVALPRLAQTSRYPIEDDGGYRARIYTILQHRADAERQEGQS